MLRKVSIRSLQLAVDEEEENETLAEEEAETLIPQGYEVIVDLPP